MSCLVLLDPYWCKVLRITGRLACLTAISSNSANGVQQGPHRQGFHY